MAGPATVKSLMSDRLKGVRYGSALVMATNEVPLTMGLWAGQARREGVSAVTA